MKIFKGFCFLIILWAVAAEAQQMKSWPKPAQFDGGKFAKRYGLTEREFGVTFIDGVEYIYVRDSSKVTGQTPIFEPPDPPKKVVTIDELLKRIENLEKKVGP